MGLFSNLRISDGYSSPPRSETYVPTALKTRRNALGRSHAAVKAQIAPELEPEISRSFGSVLRLYDFETSGMISSSRNLAYRSPIPSYSKLRLYLASAFSLAAGTTPGLTKIPI